MSINIEDLENILENDNHTILNKTYSKIKNDKNNILQSLNLPKTKLKELTEKLKEYRYIDEISDLITGNYCRWINMNIDNIELSGGGFIGNINISPTGPLLCIKTFKKFINVNANNILLFQKLNNEEKILLKVLKMIDK